MSHLNETQRYTIYRMRRDKKTQTEIARAIGVSQATVSKELSRNADGSVGQELLYTNNEVINKLEKIDGNREGLDDV